MCVCVCVCVREREREREREEFTKTGFPQPLCDNHDDGETKALILCDQCGNLCGECDRVLHYHKRARDHQRHVFKEEEEAVKVDLHEGCGRIKLYWTMALADSRTLKGMVEFRDTVGGESLVIMT